MQTFELIYEDSVQGGPTFIVEANSLDAARAKGGLRAAVECRQGYSLVNIRELTPVCRLEYERVVAAHKSAVDHNAWVTSVLSKAAEQLLKLDPTQTVEELY